ncbi:hypothetical protein J8F10_01935 [Gemmata sp. G18]|uniref:Uncharacterized protein n=1 Tax=Gemmata palustris TaxID=2822762 RepID=A0ABS5BME7_9BACT|nr:hypothetical protein [Gemmata palustris]MBP3954058.1 hypothetical protein [Gemmata palustris]
MTSVPRVLRENEVPQLRPFLARLADQVIGALLHALALGRQLLAVDLVERAVGALAPGEELFLLDEFVQFGDLLLRVALAGGDDGVDLVQFRHGRSPVTLRLSLT